MSDLPLVALLVRSGEDPQPFIQAIEHGDGLAVLFDAKGQLPDDAGGLLIAGTGAYSKTDAVPPSLTQAIEAKIPVLGIGWGCIPCRWRWPSPMSREAWGL